MRRRGSSSSWNPYRNYRRRSDRWGWDSTPIRRQAAAAGGGTASVSAVSALAVLSFAFFLNVMQQQLQSGTPTTLLVMTMNGTNGTSGNGTGASAGGNLTLGNLALNHKKKRRPGRPNRPNRRRKPHKNKKGHRWPRDVEDDYDFLDNDEYDIQEQTGPPRINAPAPERLLDWFHGNLGLDDLKFDLLGALTTCRAAIACTAQQSSQSTSSKDMMRKMLGEAGRITELDQVDQTCTDLLHEWKPDCEILAKNLVGGVVIGKN